MPASRPSSTAATRLLVLAVLITGGLSLGPTCGGGGGNNGRPNIGNQLFTSPQTNPMALSGDGSTLYVANTTGGTLTLFQADPPHAKLIAIPVGLDPVGIAVRPKVDPQDPDEPELALVTNHISDTISVVNADEGQVVQTLQLLDANGVTLTDEPTGVAFDGPSRALVTLDHPNQVIGIEFDAQGVASFSEDRATITSQAPRAIAVSNGRVYVAAFESGNKSEFTSCGPNGGPPYDPSFDADGDGEPDGTGCLFPLDLTNVLDFATDPNIGGEVVHNPLIPDRDLFVYDATDFFDADGTADAVLPVDVVEGVGTLLYGLEAVGDTAYVTHTDARNKRDGLLALENRMFDNRLAIVNCPGGSCGAPGIVDLEAPGVNPFGVPVPTPYGIRAAGDGQVLVASVAGSDGIPADLLDPSTVNVDIPGLVTLDAGGNVLGHVQTGAIPQGVVLRSDGSGAAERAYVLNTVSNTVTVVDVSNPAALTLTAQFQAGPDPTPLAVRDGRIAFSSARAATNGTFSCESCHPNANIDQILWTINTPLGLDDNCNGSGAICPEPRSTMPIRGLRDTLPLHWVGNLADPFPGTGVGGSEDPVAPDCDLSVDGELGCIRHLVDASLSGVMCEQASGCPTGPSGQDGALDAAERDAMAAFLAAVSYPPPPQRRPTDVLSGTAVLGVEDFFTDKGGLGGMVGGAATCASDEGGCHALPLTVATNSPVVGGFDAPTMRGLWDRHITFSNGITSSEDNLAEQGFDPKPDGMSEFGSLAATFPGLFTLAYNVGVPRIWQLINEMSVGLPGLTGRQLDLTPDNRGDASVGAALSDMEAAAQEGRITASARSLVHDLRYRPSDGLWAPPSSAGITGDALRDLAVSDGLTITVTAHLPPGVRIGSVDRQPLLSADDLPEPTAASPTVTLDQQYVNANAAVLVDGVRCDTCSIALSATTVDVTLSPLPASGMHVIQLHNPNSFASNEMPVCVDGTCFPGI